MLASVFMCQGLGSVASALAPFILVSAYKHPILSSIEAQNGNESAFIDAMWRIIIGLGVIPSAIALYFRLTIPETFRFTAEVRRNITEATRDYERSQGACSSEAIAVVPVAAPQLPTASWEDLRQYFSQFRNFKVLFGASYSWFALDVSDQFLSLLISCQSNIY